MSYSRTHHWARGSVGEHTPGAGLRWKLESASARHAADARLRERDRLNPVDLGEIIERDDIQRLASCLFLSPADLSRRIWSLAQEFESVDAWRRKPENVERMRAGEAELAAAVQRAREACEARR